MLRKIVLSSCFLALLWGTGCNSMPMTKPDFSAFLPAGPPAKAVAVWEPAVKHEAGEEKAKRGFGGRVYFYDQEGQKPIKINGNVVVYAFDEEGRKSDDNVPTLSVLFSKEDVKKLYSKSKLGHSYNFWIPWDSEGPDGKAKKIGLIVRYIPDVGSSVVSSQALVYLPGKPGQNEATAKAEWERQSKLDEAVRQVSHAASNGPVGDRFVDGMRYPEGKNSGKGSIKSKERLIEVNSERPFVMQSTTIQLPASVAKSLQGPVGPRRNGPNSMPEIQQAGFETQGK